MIGITKKKIVEAIVQAIIAALTALLTALSASSCVPALSAAVATFLKDSPLLALL